MKYILSIDQGTSSTRSLIFDERAQFVASDQKEHTQIYPQDAWVEHNPLEILNSVQTTMKRAVDEAKITWSQISSIGITNQRETVIPWNKRTGEPLHNAIVWQCRRTADIVEKLQLDGYVDLFKEKTGLVLDAYFSGTKMKWLLENSDKVQTAAGLNELAFGTIDSWLIFKLTGEFKTDDSNASRTLLYDLQRNEWDENLAEILGVSVEFLPSIQENAGDEPFGYMNQSGADIPIRGVLGDQQAALFGQGALQEGEVKATYGTGNFILLNTGSRIARSENGLLSTVGWKMGGSTTYALEGSVFVTGSAFQWLRDNLNLIENYGQIDDVANIDGNSGGVVFVPALVGLGAPYWDSYARGLMIGLTRGTTKSNILNATIDSVAYQTEEILQLMRKESGLIFDRLRVDGGITHSSVVMQRQADTSQVKIDRPSNIETTALGAALMAGLHVVWEKMSDMKALNPVEASFTPEIEPQMAESQMAHWRKAVKRSMGWIEA